MARSGVGHGLTPGRGGGGSGIGWRYVSAVSVVGLSPSYVLYGAWCP
ncbi:MAG: hypothetical protein RXR21_04750 [Nitrososphaeria archaeon]